LRGQHPGSFETAHAQARDRKRFALDGLPVEERYDLVVVGGGISGLSAAWFYRRAAGPTARILVLDNHDDFGGHAKRNEFTRWPAPSATAAASRSIPQENYSEVARASVRPRRRGRAVRDRLRAHALLRSGLRAAPLRARGLRRDVLVAGELPPGGAGGYRRLANAAARRIRGRVSDLAGEQDAAASFYDGTRDPLAGRTLKRRSRSSGAELPRLSHQGSAERGGSELSRPYVGFGLGCTCRPRTRAIRLSWLRGLGLPARFAREPYIYHFPRRQRPPARPSCARWCRAPRATDEDVVLAAFDYGALDRDGQTVRIRLD
jgi:spermidine dehydrogenase